MHTRKASFRLPAIIICIAAVLGVASCLGPQPETATKEWTGTCPPKGIAKFVSELGERIKMTDTNDIPPPLPPQEQRSKLMDRHIPLFGAYPNFAGLNLGIRDAVEGEVGAYIYRGREVILEFEVSVTELTDPDTLPLERRLPDCIEGVPVIIIKGSRNIIPLGAEPHD